MLRRILEDIRMYYRTSSNARYCSYLRSKGVKLGSVYFRYPQRTTIDLTRPTLITIGDNVDINDNFTIMTHDFGTFVFRNLYGDFVNSSGKVVIGNNVYFGRNVTILKGVTIGDNCIIGLGSILTHDIPCNSVAVGNPCKVICSIEDYYKKRKQQQKEEALEYGKSIVERGTLPIITDFKEEWPLFFREQDFLIYPEMHSVIDFRLKDRKKDFFQNNKPVYEGFDAFLKAIKQLK